MKKVINLVGDNFLLIITAIATALVLLIAGESRAMGLPGLVGEYNEGQQTAVQNTVTAGSSLCPTPITTASGKKICPIVTPGQVVEETLDEQLSEAP